MCTILAGQCTYGVDTVCVPMTMLRKKLLVTIMSVIFAGSIILCKNFFYIVHLQWYEIIYVIFKCMSDSFYTNLLVSNWVKIILKINHKRKSLKLIQTFSIPRFFSNFFNQFYFSPLLLFS